MPSLKNTLIDFSATLMDILFDSMFTVITIIFMLSYGYFVGYGQAEEDHKITGAKNELR